MDRLDEASTQARVKVRNIMSSPCASLARLLSVKLNGSTARIIDLHRTYWNVADCGRNELD